MERPMAISTRSNRPVRAVAGSDQLPFTLLLFTQRLQRNRVNPMTAQQGKVADSSIPTAAPQ